MAINKSKLAAVQCPSGSPGTLQTLLSADVTKGYQVLWVSGSIDAAILATAIAKFEVGLSSGGATVKETLTQGCATCEKSIAGGDAEGGLFVPAGTALQARCVASTVAINVEIIYKEILP